MRGSVSAAITACSCNQAVSSGLAMTPRMFVTLGSRPSLRASRSVVGRGSPFLHQSQRRGQGLLARVLCRRRQRRERVRKVRRQGGTPGIPGGVQEGPCGQEGVQPRMLRGRGQGRQGMHQVWWQRLDGRTPGGCWQESQGGWEDLQPRMLRDRGQGRQGMHQVRRQGCHPQNREDVTV